MRFLSHVNLPPLGARLAATLCLVLCSLACRAQDVGARALDTMAERTRACTACHGEQGRATPAGYFPRIAG
jgi:cytochrome c553